MGLRRHLPAVAAITAMLTLAGCFDSPDAGSDALTGPGVRSTSFIEDDQSCSPLLYAQAGCVAIRLPEAESQCVGATVDGYIDCAITLHWNASVGPASGELQFTLEGYDNRTATCDAEDGCSIPGNITLEHAFSGTDQAKEWVVELEAFLDSGTAGQSPDWFRLKVVLRLES